MYYSSLQIRYFKQKYKDQHLFASYDCDRSTNRRSCIDGEQQSISSDTDDSTASSSSSSEENGNLSCVISSLQRQQQLDAASNDATKTMKTRQSRSTPRPDSSFWRTKVNWRWQSSSSTSTSITRKSAAAVANRASSSGSDRYSNRTSSYSRRDQVVGVGSSHSYLLN